jgi:hypothetical protein
MIAKVETRLGAVFQRAILVALAGIGCGTKAADMMPTADAGGTDGGVVEAGAGDGGKEAGPPDPCQATTYTPSPPDTCGDYIKYPCGVPAELVVRGACYFAVNDCASLCPDVHFSCRAADGYCTDAGGPDAANVDGKLVPDEAGAMVIDCATCPGSAGRIPAGLELTKLRARTELGAYFASAARLEAASVTAFRRLHEELALHGAPAELLDAARAAEHDEVKHTRSMARLARRHGERYVRPRVLDVPLRSLDAVAYENAVEGCARETFGALLATWQATHVDDPELARTLEGIADDETRHAALSWAIARWSASRLDRDACARMESAWSAALEAMAAGEDGCAPGIAGLPSREERTRLAAELRGLWSDVVEAA